MRSRLTSVFAYSALAVTALFISFVFGVYVGADQLLQMDSSSKAFLLVHDLKAIRSGANEKLVKVKEIELDAAVTQALRFEEFGYPWLFWPLANGYDHHKHLRAVALYRKDHPSPAPTIGSGGGNAHSKEMETYRAEVAARTAQLLERYGN
jgi:hypothetical protein